MQHNDLVIAVLWFQLLTVWFAKLTIPSCPISLHKT